uniref:Alpha-mannosidase n=1 Tax=Rhabditophanes sp. KR3021 TaxID=114890 RepID=A0AC35UAH3_9BILA
MLHVYQNFTFNKTREQSRLGYYDVKYTAEEVRENPKLDVIIIPHSHTDPGWKSTFEEHYHRDVHQILGNMESYLRSHERMKFIYAEMSFFEMHWSKLSDGSRKQLKEYLTSGQFEIVTGAWVQTDEANSHYFAMIMQLIEGHEFLTNHLQYIPKNHWAIDPFGLSPTMAYFMKEAGFDNAVIGRVHYQIKQLFAQNKLFEFKWANLFDSSGKDDIFTHVLPLTSYMFYESCSVDPTVCCSLDFMRLSKYGCNSGINPVRVTEHNLRKQSLVAADAFRKRGLLMNNSATFIPMGYDFAWDTIMEWSDQYDNYVQIFDYINNDKDLNMNIRFGTLQDYFETVHRNQKMYNKKTQSITGDFFTYSDEGQDYWSGYYTSRPFFKRFDRILQHHIRAGDILFSHLLINKIDVSSIDYNLLVEARRSMSLFQHHDGITGTSNHHVMEDYRDKLVKAVQNCYTVIEESIKKGLNLTFDIKLTKKVLDGDKIIQNEPLQNDVNGIVLFNPLASDRSEIICILMGNEINTVKDVRLDEQELHPHIVFINGVLAKSGNYYLCFKINLGPLEVKMYELRKHCGVGLVGDFVANTYFENKYDDIGEFVFKAGKNEVEFSKETGLPIKINSTPLNVEFKCYGTTYEFKHTSGAYLFRPNGTATSIASGPAQFAISKGKLLTRVVRKSHGSINLMQKYEIYADKDGIYLENIIDITNKTEIEVIMHLATDIKSGSTFYTDLNAYQMIKRKRLDSLPIQGNYYPMPSTILIEDTKQRLTVIGNQPLGASSLENGAIEIMLDRKLEKDDDRGLDEPMTDSLQTRSQFVLLLEEGSFEVENKNKLAGHWTKKAFSVLNEIYYPVTAANFKGDSSTAKWQNIISLPLPKDYHLVALRSMLAKETYHDSNCNDVPILRKSSNQIALIIKRTRLADDAKEPIEKVDITTYFDPSLYVKIEATSLTLLHTLSQTSTAHFSEMDTKTFKLTISNM